MDTLGLIISACNETHITEHESFQLLTLIEHRHLERLSEIYKIKYAGITLDSAQHLQNHAQKEHCIRLQC